MWLGEKQHISAEEFAKKYKAGEWGEPEIQLVDVREPEEWAVYHLERSRLIPLSELPERIGELDPSRKTAVMCAHGIRSLHAAWFLLQNGFSDVVNVNGGLAEVSLYLDEEDLKSGT
jgi:rhodanese-related sulfurtransferase